MSINDFDKAEIKDSEWERMRISNAANRPNAKTSYGPGKTAAQTKEIFDAPLDELKNKHNLLLGYAKKEEAAREAAEKARLRAEGSIDSNNEYYGGRALAEKERSDAEKKRSDAEKERADTEKQRQIAELGAVGNYYDESTQRVKDSKGNFVDSTNAGRVGAEILRTYGEYNRDTQETARLRAEGSIDSNNEYYGGRALAEDERKVAEIIRMNQEDYRVSNENIRKAKDAERDGKIAGIEALVGEIDVALDSIISMQESLIGGES